MNGWIKLHRKILDNPISGKPSYLSLWVHILLMANHKEKKFMWNGKIEIIKDGQLLTGRKELAEKTGIPEGSIDRLLNFLESEHQIEQQKTSKFRIITILNWKEYQTPNTEMNNKRTTDEQQVNTNKNDKNVKKSSEPSSEPEPPFDLPLEIQKLRSNERRKDLRLVGYYFQRKGLEIPTREVFQKELRRALAEIKTLKDFPDEKIVRAFDYVEREFPDIWTIETVGKTITNKQL